MEYHECDYAKDRTERNGRRGFCEVKKRWCLDGNGDMFHGHFANDGVTEVDKKDICVKGSQWGNYYIELTDDQLEEMKNGKVFALLGREYNIFIGRA